MLSNTHISSLMDGWRIMSTVVYGCICGACFLILIYPVWWIYGALWALLYMVASMEQAFQYFCIQCNGWCIMSTVYMVASVEHAFNTHISSVIDKALWALLYMIISEGHALQYLHIQCVGWLAHNEHCCVWLHLLSMLSNNCISSVLDGWRIMSSVVYDCICGACFPIPTYLVWYIVHYKHWCI